MISAVLDTNTLVSAILVELGISRRILRGAYEREFACISSTPIVTEVLRTLGSRRIQRKYQIPATDVDQLRRFLESDLVSIPIVVTVQGVATPKMI